MSGTETGRRTTPGGLAVSALRVAAVASVLAGLVHYAVVPEHRAEWWADAVFFTVLGGFQLVWGALAWTDGSRRLAWSGAAVSLGVVALWALVRTAGLPFGPDAGEPESVGLLDSLCSLSEVVVAAAALLGARAVTATGERAPWSAESRSGDRMVAHAG